MTESNFRLNPIYLTTASQKSVLKADVERDYLIPRLKDLEIDHSLKEVLRGYIGPDYPTILLEGNSTYQRAPRDHIMSRLKSETNGYKLGVRAVVVAPNHFRENFDFSSDFTTFTLTERSASNLEDLQEKPILYTDHGSPRVLLFHPRNSLYTVIEDYYRLPSDLFLPSE